MPDLRDVLREQPGVAALFAATYGVDVEATVEKLGAGEPWRCHHNVRGIVRQRPNYVWWTGFAAGYPRPPSWCAHSWVVRDGEHLEVTFARAAVAYVGVAVPPGFEWAAGPDRRDRPRHDYERLGAAAVTRQRPRPEGRGR